MLILVNLDTCDLLLSKATSFLRIVSRYDSVYSVIDNIIMLYQHAPNEFLTHCKQKLYEHDQWTHTIPAIELLVLQFATSNENIIIYYIGDS